MENDYLCPKCRGHLKIADFIVFSARTQKGTRGLLFLSPKLGDYTVISHPSFNLVKGEHLDLYCPLCFENLVASEVSINLGKVIMVDENKNEYDIYFSEIVGERCTYKISKNFIEAFGEDASQYINYFGETPKY